MAITIAVQEFLRRANVDYTVFRHAPAYTAQEEAALAHVPGRNWAKVVVCIADGEPIQVVVPADLHVDLERLAEVVVASEVRLAREDELVWLFPDCEPGAMPPFGPLFRQRVYVDRLLAEDEEIVFNGGTHVDAVIMRYEDFAGLTEPTVGRFAIRRA
jgi:Ala-tRNA(Pro) deacylase